MSAKGKLLIMQCIYSCVLNPHTDITVRKGEDKGINDLKNLGAYLAILEHRFEIANVPGCLTFKDSSQLGFARI